MRKYIYIGCGGFTGAILRYLIEQIRIQNYHESIPLNTLFINVSGAFLLAFILTIAFEVWEMDSDIRLGITTGFLGAYTTFSTLCKETVMLLRGGEYLSAIFYIIISAMLGLGAAYLGVVLARKTGSLMIKKQENKNTEILSETEEWMKDEGKAK
jgi:CrcB protein